MTEINITANGKFYYHYVINRQLTEQEISKQIKENTYPKPGVEFQATIKSE